MVSFQAHHPIPSPNPNGSRKTIPIPELDNSSKKRKWAEPKPEEFLEKTPKSEVISGTAAGIAPIFDIELHLDTPLPLEWQRCLDIQSGQIHFYNTRTHMRTSRDPRRSPEPQSPGHNHISLDLELNLTCDSRSKDQAKSHTNNTKLNDSGSSMRPMPAFGDDFFTDSIKDHGREGLKLPCPSWLAFERERDEQEMVATVCTRCHMLVMLCKSSPACPNCKFLHPPDQSPPKLFKQRLSLLC